MRPLSGAVFLQEAATVRSDLLGNDGSTVDVQFASRETATTHRVVAMLQVMKAREPKRLL